VDGDGRLEVRDLWAGYQRESPVLKGVSLRVDPGEVCAIIGPNGAGKSTLLKAIYGLIKSSEGSIRYGSHDLIGMAPEDLASIHVGYVPQERNVFAMLSVRENLELACAVSGRQRAVQVREIMKRYTLLESKASSRAGTLSGGQRQILAIAMALINSPKLILLDEPTAGLSPAARSDVFERVRSLTRDGRSVLLVEQNALEALNIADRGYVFVDGRDFVNGSAESMLHDPAIRKSFLGIFN
jgi:branched-chain amino acid transport system ATP-binding protein/neutral amino acid transport system ATP-binding protein